MTVDISTPGLIASGLNAAAEIADTPEARNFYLLGPGRWTAVVLNVQQEALTYALGGFDVADLRAQSRLVAVPGARCTILGIARTVDAMLNSSAANDAEKLSVEDIARALYEYNAAWLGSLVFAPKTGAPLLPSWRIGCHFTLPIEPKLGDANARLVTDLVALQALADSFDDQLEAALYAEVTPLEALPDCDQIVAAAAARLATQWTDGGKIAVGVVENLLKNPFDELLLLVETLLARKGTDLADIVLDVVGRLLAPQLELLTQTTAGYAALRQFFFALQSAPASAARTVCLEKLGTALVLAKNAAGAFIDPRLVGPNLPAPPIEPPLVGGQVVKVDKLTANTAMLGAVYGRLVPVGTATSYTAKDKTVWIGPSEAGQSDPAIWWRANSALLGKDLGPPAPPLGAGIPVAAARTLERIELASKIAENEGLLDVCRAADVGIISTGLHQWSAHTGDELTVLLERFRVQSPEHYDLYFGAFGLQTRAWAKPILVGIEVTGKKGKKSGVTSLVELDPDDPGLFELGANKTVIDLATYRPTSYGTRPGDFKADPYEFRLTPQAFSLRVEAANPFGRDSSVDPLQYFPSYATVFKVAPGSKLKRLPPVGFGGAFSDLRPRLEFFGGLIASSARRFGPAWSARIRLAGRASIPYRVAQLHTAAWRFTRIDLDDNFVRRTFQVEGRAYSLPELLSSTFAAACILDLHINAPGNVSKAVDDAVARTKLPAHVAGVLDEQWRRRFTINIMAARNFPDASAKRDRDGRLIAYHDAPKGAVDRSLSPDPGSFTGW